MVIDMRWLSNGASVHRGEHKTIKVEHRTNGKPMWTKRDQQQGIQIMRWRTRSWWLWSSDQQDEEYNILSPRPKLLLWSQTPAPAQAAHLEVSSRRWCLRPVLGCGNVYAAWFGYMNLGSPWHLAGLGTCPNRTGATRHLCVSLETAILWLQRAFDAIPLALELPAAAKPPKSNLPCKRRHGHARAPVKCHALYTSSTVQGNGKSSKDRTL